MQDGGSPAPTRPVSHRRKIVPIHWNSLWVIMAAVTLCLSLAAVLCITGIVYRHADNTINQSIAQNNSQIVANVTASIDSYLGEMVSISDEVASLLGSQPIDKLQNGLFVFLRDDVETIAVFDTQGNPVLTVDSRPMRTDIQVTRQSWFSGVTAGPDGYLLSQPHVQRLYRGSYPWVITLTRAVTWYEDNEAHTGVVMVDMNFSRIKDLCARDLENDGYLYIADERGQIVYHPKQQMIYAGILPQEVTLATDLSEGTGVVEGNDGPLAVCVQTLTSASWRVIGVASLAGLATYDSGPGTYVITAILLLAQAVLLASIFISGSVVRPLHRLMALMGRMTDAGEMQTAPTGGVYEAGQLARSFNRMSARIVQLMGQVREEQKQLHRSELKALNAQINPHFLYNTLDSVIWLAESGDEKNVIQMVMALSKYFRLSLSGARDYITVSDELQQVENYLIIQKMRFGDSFSYTIFCEEDVKTVRTPKILLQPVVENAIVHGVDTTEGGGRIEIAARREGDNLVMEVRDNGCGIKPEILAHILETDAANSAGIGIKNVHQRIQLACGPEYGLSVESELDEGTIVRLHLPLRLDSPAREERV